MLLLPLFKSTVLGGIRDRLLHGIFFCALILLAVVPAISLFSMRQVQELSLSLSLSANSVVLCVLAVLLGSSSVWRDLEKRYTAGLLGLPVSRASYLFARFAGLALLLSASALILGLASVIVTSLASAQYPSAQSIHWGNFITALLFDLLKYLLLGTFALFLSTLSTSFFLPIFGSFAVFFAGSASQNVMEYVQGALGDKMAISTKALINFFYYLLPNFSAFDYHLHAIYGLPIEPVGLLLTLLYTLIYLAILLSLASWIFSRRELP